MIQEILIPFGAFMLVFIIGSGVWYLRETRLLQQLKQRGHTTQAEVISKKRNVASRGSACYVNCRFHYEGQTFEYRREVSVATYTRCYPGGQIPVYLLPEKPKSMRVVGDTQILSRARFAFIMSWVVTIVSPALFFLGFRLHG